MRLLLFAFNLPARNVWLEAFSKVDRAHDRIHDCHQNEYDSDDREGGQRLPGRKILGSVRRLIHAEELEDEVGQGDDV